MPIGGCCPEKAGEQLRGASCFGSMDQQPAPSMDINSFTEP